VGNCLPLFFISMANKLQFEVLENKSVEVLILNNFSVLETPLQNPTWKIKAPGFTDFKNVALDLLPVQNITGFDIDIVCEECLVNPLPDGIYEIILQETVASVVNSFTKYHLRTNVFASNYAEILMKMEYSEYTKTEDTALLNFCVDVDMLLQSAKAHAEEGNIQKATELFAKASKILTRISNNLKSC